MAFFDNLGKKISQAGQTAVQKTKEITDLARINSVISEEEKKVNNQYFQIGKLYVAKHAEDHEEDFSGMIAAIKASENKIGEYRQQIQEIKGIVRCEKCGAEVSGTVAFCSSCGAAMPKPAVNDELVKCASCGVMVNKNMRFCTACGSPMQENKASEEPLQNEAKNCPQCGAALEGDLSFCPECGTKLK